MFDPQAVFTDGNYLHLAQARRPRAIAAVEQGVGAALKSAPEEKRIEKVDDLCSLDEGTKVLADDPIRIIRRPVGRRVRASGYIQNAVPGIKVVGEGTGTRTSAGVFGGHSNPSLPRNLLRRTTVRGIR